MVSVFYTPWCDSGYMFGVSLRGFLETIQTISRGMGDDFIVSPYSALSLVWLRLHALRPFMELLKGRRIQRYAWFNSGCKFMRQTTVAGFAGDIALRAVLSSSWAGP